ncbi:MAG: methyltransferase domain-containing protein [Acidimicrobiia bacterium]|nr:methyltransferase domain-containing protein [Acidimicrobiia bacterium]
MATGESISFDKVASIYDATRGGLERGRRFASALAAASGPDPVIEIGIGTGAIALPFRELTDRTVVGVDLSPAMLVSAHERLGSVVAVADVARLPYRDRSVGTVVACWVLHLVGDPIAVLTECRRVLAPGGRLLVISARGEVEPDDIEPFTIDLHDAIRGRFDVHERLVPAAADAGLRLVSEQLTEAATWMESPADLIERMEQRQWGALIDLEPDRYAEIVQPVVDGLRTLPDPDRKRGRTGRNPLFVFAAD